MTRQLPDHFWLACAHGGRIRQEGKTLVVSQQSRLRRPSRIGLGRATSPAPRGYGSATPGVADRLRSDCRASQPHLPALELSSASDGISPKLGWSLETVDRRSVRSLGSEAKDSILRRPHCSGATDAAPGGGAVGWESGGDRAVWLRQVMVPAFIRFPGEPLATATTEQQVSHPPRT
jgi:hypothetical protein